MHHIQGLIARKDCLYADEKLAPRDRIADLQQGFALLLVNDDAGNPADDAFPPNVAAAAQRLSARAPVAFIETSYFAGQGIQRAALWVDGELVRTHRPDAGPRDISDYPINSVLRELGVTTTGDTDEFDALSLGRFRSNEDWLASIKRIPTGIGN